MTTASLATDRVIAYFSMEIALDPRMPTYAGGLGVLAGDTIRAAADLRVPLVGVSLLYRQGYFSQQLDHTGLQHEEPTTWPVDRFTHELPARVAVTIEGRRVALRAWRYTVTGVGGGAVQVYLLDSDLPDNARPDRGLTAALYGGDARCRLAQEIVLGMGGVLMLRALGYRHIRRFHMNEGHASLLTLALLDEQAERTGRWIIGDEEVARVRQQCVFTTHTPVPAGHDEFSMSLVTQVLGRPEIAAMPQVFCANGQLNLTTVGLNLSCYVNAVARRHGETSRSLLNSHTIDAVTNGIHAATWTCPAFQTLYDQFIPGWRQDNSALRHAMAIPLTDIRQAHGEAKQQLLDVVLRQTGVVMDPSVLTIGFARRVAAYKRATLLFQDLDRLTGIARTAGPFQVIYAGKAHPNDPGAKQLIQHIFQAIDTLKPAIRVVYLANYEWTVAQLLTAGCDVWLNTPLRPLEASGTSGMKAAVNGVPSLSILDGWWVEGHVEGVTGWSIGDSAPVRDDAQQRLTDSASLYDKLQQVVLPLYYQNPTALTQIMRQAIAFNGSHFNTHRMLHDYVLRAYFR